MRVNTHAAPLPLPSSEPPTSAVSPAAESATLEPKKGGPAAPAPSSFACSAHDPGPPPYTHAAPTSPLSPGAATSAVVPAPDSATLKPKPPPSICPLPVSLPPCCVQTVPERVKVHAAPQP